MALTAASFPVPFGRLSSKRVHPTGRHSQRTDFKTMFAVVRTGAASSIASPQETRSRLRSWRVTPVKRSCWAMSCSPAKAASCRRPARSPSRPRSSPRRRARRCAVFKKRRRHNYRRKARAPPADDPAARSSRSARARPRPEGCEDRGRRPRRSRAGAGRGEGSPQEGCGSEGEGCSKTEAPAEKAGGKKAPAKKPLLKVRGNKREKCGRSVRDGT